MKTTLIKLQDKFILVSDEEHKIGDKIIHKTTFDLTGTPDLIGSTFLFKSNYTTQKDFKTPTESYLEAIKYCLTKLI